MKKWFISYSSGRELSNNDLRDISSRFNGFVEAMGKSNGKERWNYSLHSDKPRDLTADDFAFFRDKGITPFLYHQKYDNLVKETFSQEA